MDTTSAATPKTATELAAARPALEPMALEPVDTESMALEPVDGPRHLDTLPPVVAPRRAAVVRQAKRVGVGVAGTSVMGAGVAMLVLPGPGIVVIIAGLAILATEFAWAERRLHQAKAKAAAAAEAARSAGKRSRRKGG